MNTAQNISVDQVFTGLAKEEERLLVSLPYRIGLFVSYADVTGGFEAQEKEQQTLANILRQYSEDFCKTEFTQKVLMETLMRRDDWHTWAQNIENVPQEAGRIVDILSALFKEKDMRAFKEVMVEIALSVAMSFHEGRDGDYTAAAPKSSGGFWGFFKKKTEAGPLDHVHISAAERAALRRVCQAMKYRM